ncbi:YchJ family protein [Cryptosporangium phraense]|uniref:Zinc chelation protein SecC n=1 Tax=Cryptosporangium phraense TaxID=2593070 RepID=A0A545AIN8_9ACTN|nr:YchJ family metal-binding protein [Cryptosporangium phraense]TQS41186.1 zinc chelation protein SecC [Cryptosporangium phraense]
MCPCGSRRPYAECCEPFHRGGAAPTAEALMRSRYSAFARGLAPYLLATWHPSTRPDHLALDVGLTWRALQIVDTVDGGPDDDTGVVEFRAIARTADGERVEQHERSTFDRIGGRWVYRDGGTGPLVR